MSEPISEPGNPPNQPGKAVKLEKQPHGGALRRGGGRKPGHGNRATRFRVDAATDEQSKAETLFRGMFERASGNVSKGRFAQALASKIQDEKLPFEAPAYVLSAIDHVCQ